MNTVLVEGQSEVSHLSSVNIPEGDSRNSTHPVILIVEDEAILAEDLKEILEYFGYEICAILPAGEQALAELPLLKPDLILMDIHLSGELDGIEVAARITSEFPVPVIYLTAFCDDETMARAKNTNPYGYIVKPFNKETVHSMIQIALAKNQRDQKIHTSLMWHNLIFRNIDRGFVVLDKEKRIVHANAFAEQVLGLPLSAICNLPFDETILFHDDIFHERYIPPLLSVLDKGLAKIFPSDILLAAEQGETFRIKEGVLSPVFDNQGAIRGALFSFNLEKAPAQKNQSPLGKPGAYAGDNNDSRLPDRKMRPEHTSHTAIQELKEAITCSQTFENAALRTLLGKFEDALSIYNHMLTTDPENYLIWHNRGTVQMKLGRHLEALHSFTRALSLNPSSKETHYRKEDVLRILSMKKRKSYSTVK